MVEKLYKCCMCEKQAWQNCLGGVMRYAPIAKKPRKAVAENEEDYRLHLVGIILCFALCR